MNYYNKSILLFILMLGHSLIALTQCSITLSNARPTCFSDSTGQLIFSLEAVNFPVTAALNNTSFQLNTATWTIDDLGAGTYLATFSDSQGCTGEIEISLEEAPEMDAVNLNYSLCPQLTEICDDFETTGGIPPYSMVWDWGPTFPSDEFCFPIENDRTTTVEIMDAIGCTIERTIQSEPDFEFLRVTHYRTDCNESIATVYDAGTAIFNPTWSNGSTNLETLADTFGLYTVSTFNGEGCEHRGSYFHGPLAPIASITPVGCTTGDNTGRINISYDNYVNQTPPANLEWTGPNGYSGTGRPIENLFTGDYYVNISFGNESCGEFGPFTVGPSDMQFDPIITDFACFDNNLGSIRITTTGGITPYEYLWSNGSTSRVISNLTPDIYSLTVTDAGGCTATETYEILNINPFPISSVNAEVVSTCDGVGQATVEVEGGSGTLMIEWSNGEIGPTATNLDFGENWVSVTDSLGCSVYDTLTILPIFDLNFTTTLTDCNQNDGSATVSVSGEINTPSYAWSNGQTNQTAVDLAPGGYSVTVTDLETGCRVHRNVMVEEDPICFVKISGYAYLDEEEQACNPDGNIDPLYFMKVKLNEDQLTFTDANGYYEFIADVGEYTVSILPFAGTHEGICIDPIIVNASNWGNEYGDNNFYLKWGDQSDLELKVSKQNARPGFDQRVRICLMNVGAIPRSGILTFIHPTIQDYIDSSPLETNYDSTNHTATWEFTDIPPGEIWIYNANLHTPVETALGTPLSYEFYADPIGNDLTPENNYKQCSIAVTGSYDPNDKAVTPMGIGEEGIISMSDSILSYTIRFQNTGTDTAFTVVIRDTLNENLVVESLRPGPASHPYSLTVKDENKLAFLFENILLPDSFINEPASHGFVIFDAKVRRDAPYGTVIDNRAGIYFDFNPPIITNKVINNLKMITDIEELPDVVFSIYPNPNKGVLYIQHDQPDPVKINIYDLKGMLLETHQLSSSNQLIDIRKLQKGAYIVELIGEQASGYEKLIKY